MKTLIVLFLASIFFAPSHGFYQTSACADDPNKVIAEVLGRKITESELQKELSIDLYEMQKNIHTLKQQ